MALIRICGDLRLPLPAHERDLEARASVVAPAADEARVTVEASRAVAPAAEKRPAAVTIPGPNGETTRIYPVDHLRRARLYEGLARAEGVPVSHVWWIVHEDRHLRFRAAAAVTAVREGTPDHTIWLNVLRLAPCALHRLSSFTHELEHVRRGDCRSAEPHSLAQEQACDAAADRRVRAAVSVAQRSAPCRIDEGGCRTCAAGGAAPCPQGAAVYAAVQEALAPL